MVIWAFLHELVAPKRLIRHRNFVVKEMTYLISFSSFLQPTNPLDSKP